MNPAYLLPQRSKMSDPVCEFKLFYIYLLGCKKMQFQTFEKTDLFVFHNSISTFFIPISIFFKDEPKDDDICINSNPESQTCAPPAYAVALLNKAILALIIIIFS
jgi:hypothetical protein